MDAMTERTGASGWARAFAPFWASQAVSLLGSAVLQFALVWWLAQATGSATVLAAAALVAILPMALLGPLAGTLVDRADRKRLVILSDLASAAVALGLALLFASGRATPAWVLAALLARAVAAAVQAPARAAVVASMVPAAQLTRVQGLDQAVQALLAIGAPPLGALAIGSVPLAAVVGLDVATAVIAAALVLPLALPGQPRADGQARPSFAAELVEGMRYVRGRSGLLVLIALAAVINAALVPAFSLLPLLVTRVLAGGPLELGWLGSAFAAGSLAGGVALASWGGSRRRIPTALGAMIVIGLASAALAATAPGRWLLAFAAMTAVGLAQPLANGPIAAAVQATVPPHLLGRVLALLTSACTIAAPLGLLAAGPLADLLGVRAWFLLGGTVTVLAAAAGFAFPSLRRLEEPHGEEARPEA